VHGQSFDRIIRLWGTNTDRRRALQLIGTGVMAGSWLNRGSKTAAAQSSAAQLTCTQDADCQDGDADPCTGGICQEGFCTFFIVSCIAGTTCCGNGECCPVESTENCTADVDCAQTSHDSCWGTRCVTGACEVRHVECPAGAYCRDGACVPFGARSIAMP
jgi:hypothetical protein